MRIRISRARHGSVLLMALLTVVIIGISLSSYLWVVSDQNQSTMRSQAWNSVIPVVEAGLEEALTQLHYTDIDHLSANGWTDVGNGWYSKQRHVDDRSYYEVMIKQVSPANLAGPVIVSTGYVPAPLVPASLLGMLWGDVPPPASAYVKRRVQVNTVPRPLFHGAMLVRGTIDMSGNSVTTDGFDSSDSNYSTNGKYDAARNKASGDVGTNLGLVDSIGVASADIKGRVGTGPGGPTDVGPNGSVGDLAWVPAGTDRIQHGWSSEDIHFDVFDVQAPFTTNYGTPGGGNTNNTTYDYILDQNQNYKLSDFGGKVLVTGNATLWVTDSVNFGTDDYIHIAPGASLKLYVSAVSAVIGGSGVMNSDAYATSFQYYGLPSNTSLFFQANASFTGSIYAPQAALTLGGGGNNDYDFVGSCVVNSIKLNGHYHFHFDEALMKALWKGYVAAAWNEIDPNAPTN